MFPNEFEPYILSIFRGNRKRLEFESKRKRFHGQELRLSALGLEDLGEVSTAMLTVNLTSPVPLKRRSASGLDKRFNQGSVFAPRRGFHATGGVDRIGLRCADRLGDIGRRQSAG